jgi:hypothetical protein
LDILLDSQPKEGYTAKKKQMWGLLKKLIRKKPKMENIEELDIEVLDYELKPFAYRWTKGDNNGNVCEYESVFKDATTGVIWVNFKDGSRINYSLLNEYMIQIDPLAPRQTIEAISRVLPNTRQIPVRNVMLSEPTQVSAQAGNPITSLLEKQKPHWVEVGIKLKLNLPTKSLYNVLTTSFDEAEKEIIEFVVNDLDLEIIKESLRINIKEIYKGNNGNIRKGGTNISTEEQEH